MQTHTQLKTPLSKGRGKCYQLKLETDSVYSQALNTVTRKNHLNIFFKYIVIKNLGHKLHEHVSENKCEHWMVISIVPNWN